MNKLLARIVFVIALPLLTAGCFGDPETGPVEIKWDRDTCEVCRMLISDRHYAAQLRGGPKHKAYKFDDMGELVHWLDVQTWKNDPKVELWVMDMDTGSKWLDARKVRYMPNQTTPMNYGFGAVEDNRKGSVSFEEMVKKVRQRGSTYHCLPAEQRSS
ncbi:MAG: protein NosL [bacterium]|nr:protein NosL [bacterium]